MPSAQILMTSSNPDTARRLDRLLRLEFLRDVGAITGWLLILAGVVSLLMTARFKGNDLSGMLAANPKLSLTVDARHYPCVVHRDVESSP
jgi:hypothetical protein